MQKIILTIIILAVAKSVFAAPNPTYLDRDATKLQTVSFPITPSTDIQDRITKLDDADSTNTAAAEAALEKAKEAPRGSDALAMAKRIKALILDSNSCLHDNSTDCTQKEIDFKEQIEYLGGDPGETHTLTDLKGAVSVKFILWSAIGRGPGATWVRINSSDRIFRPGGLKSGSIARSVRITQAHRDNGIKYYKGIGNGLIGLSRHGTIRATFKIPRDK